MMEQFPPIDRCRPDGLLAIGGDLSVERLLLAYRNGIFPWFSPGDPILWWSPDPRCVIFPHQFHPSKSLRKSTRNRGYTVTFDTTFAQVIERCAGKRQSQDGTWITDDMKTAYHQLHQLGVAHSVEVWHEGKLVGGLYGIAMGRIFFGESMFSCMTDASKVGLATLINKLVNWGFTLIDCQVSSPHILSLGAIEIPRKNFLVYLEEGVVMDSKESNWRSRQSAL